MIGSRSLMVDLFDLNKIDSTVSEAFIGQDKPEKMS